MVFKYKAYKALLLELGRLDYIFEVTQLAILDFTESMEQHEDKREFLKSKSLHHGIIVNYDKDRDLNDLVILSQIANVYHYAETFFYELKDEYNSYCLNEDQELSFVKGETKFNQLKYFLQKNGRINLIDKIPETLIDIFQYYHILRIYFSHKPTTEERDITAKYNAAINHFKKDEQLLQKYRILNHPNELGKLTFNDYFLFTQVTKELCLILSSLMYPQPEGFAQKEGLKSKIINRPGTSQKERVISGFLSTEFGYICNSDADKRNFLDVIIQNL